MYGRNDTLDAECSVVVETKAEQKGEARHLLPRTRDDSSDEEDRSSSTPGPLLKGNVSIRQ